MSDFRQAIETVIAVHEGGFQDSKDDPGNYTPDGVLKGTKYGISAASFPSEDIENLTMARAEELYREVYGGFTAIADQRVLTKILDLAVNMEYGDHGPATRILQTAINACGPPYVALDGIFGPDTMDKCNRLEAGMILPAICDAAAAYYKVIEAKRPGEKGWFNNWNTRAIWLPPAETTSGPVL